MHAEIESHTPALVQAFAAITDGLARDGAGKLAAVQRGLERLQLVRGDVGVGCG